MKKIKIITDSASDITQKKAEENDICVLPLSVSFGNEVFKDGVDISNSEFYSRIRAAEELPKTAQVGVAAFEDAFRKFADRDIIYISLSAKGSGTCQNAFMAKEMVTEEYPDIDITIIDSNNYTYGYGLWVLLAAKMVQNGAGREQVVRYLTESLEDSEIMLSVSSLEYLQKGGRISSAAKTVANVLDIRPVLCTKDGMINSFSKARGSKKLLGKLTDIVAERIGDCRQIGVIHTDYPEMIPPLKELLSEKIPDAEFFEGEVGPCIGVHAGPGAFGVVYRKKKEL